MITGGFTSSCLLFCIFKIFKQISDSFVFRETLHNFFKEKKKRLSLFPVRKRHRTNNCSQIPAPGPLPSPPFRKLLPHSHPCPLRTFKSLGPAFMLPFTLRLPKICHVQFIHRMSDHSPRPTTDIEGLVFPVVSSSAFSL